jgi:hypothetical protein
MRKCKCQKHQIPNSYVNLTGQEEKKHCRISTGGTPHKRRNPFYWLRSGLQLVMYENLAENNPHDLQQVQTDKINVNIQKGTIWMESETWVPTRLWMGG